MTASQTPLLLPPPVETNSHCVAWTVTYRLPSPPDHVSIFRNGRRYSCLERAPRERASELSFDHSIAYSLSLCPCPYSHTLSPVLPRAYVHICYSSPHTTRLYCAWLGRIVLYTHFDSESSLNGLLRMESAVTTFSLILTPS